MISKSDIKYELGRMFGIRYICDFGNRASLYAYIAGRFPEAPIRLVYDAIVEMIIEAEERIERK